MSGTFWLILPSCDRPLSRRLDRCDRVIQNESTYPFGGNVYYVTMQITFLTRKFRNGERNLHCDVVHITTKWVSSLTLDCNGVFAIKAYSIELFTHQNQLPRIQENASELITTTAHTSSRQHIVVEDFNIVTGRIVGVKCDPKKRKTKPSISHPVSQLNTKITS